MKSSVDEFMINDLLRRSRINYSSRRLEQVLIIAQWCTQGWKKLNFQYLHRSEITTTKI